MTHTKVTPCHLTDAPTEAYHIIDTQILTISDVTHPIGGLPHTEALLCIQETTVGLGHILHTR